MHNGQIGRSYSKHAHFQNWFPSDSSKRENPEETTTTTRPQERSDNYLNRNWKNKSQDVDRYRKETRVYQNRTSNRRSLEEGTKPLTVLEERLEKCIKDPFAKEVNKLKDLISNFDQAGAQSQSAGNYAAFGDFFLNSILIPACEGLELYAEKCPQHVAKTFIFIYNSIRSLVHFRQGKIFSKWCEEQNSIATLMISCALKYPCPEIRLQLIELARQNHPLGDFFKQLLLFGRLAGLLTLSTDPHPALDLGAYALLLLNDDFAVRQAEILKKQEQASYFSKGFFLFAEYPKELIRRLREKSKSESLEIIIKDYTDRFEGRSQEHTEFEKISNSLDSIAQQCLPSVPAQESLCIRPSTPSIPQEIDIGIDTFQSYQPVEDIKSLQPIHPPFKSGLNSALNLIDEDRKTEWPKIYSKLKRLLDAYPNRAEEIKIKVVFALIESRWKSELKEFIENHLSKFPRGLWLKILCFTDSPSVIKSLKALNFLMEVFSEEKESKWKLYLREQIIDRILTSGYKVQDSVDGKLFAFLCISIHKTFKDVPPKKSMFERFVQMTSYTVEIEEVDDKEKEKEVDDLQGAETSKERSVLDLIPSGEEVLTSNLSHLHTTLWIPDRSKLAAYSELLQQICHQKKLTKEHRQLIGKIIEQINDVFFKALKKENKDFKTFCNEYKAFLSTLTHPDMAIILESTQRFTWYLTHCWFDVHQMEVSGKIDLDCIISNYPQIFRYQEVQDQSNKPIVSEISRRYYILMLDSLDLWPLASQNILRDLLLFVYAFKLFDFNIETIVRTILEEPNRKRTHAALAIISGFFHLKHKNKPMITFELLKWIIPAFFNENDEEQSDENKFEWDRDMMHLSDLIYDNFYLSGNKQSRAAAKVTLFDLAHNARLNVAKSNNFYVLNRKLLRLGPGINRAYAIVQLSWILDLAIDNSKKKSDIPDHIHEVGLISGRVAFIYRDTKKICSYKGISFSGVEGLNPISNYEADLNCILGLENRNEERLAGKMETGKIEEACALAELFSCHMAKLGVKKSKKLRANTTFDPQWWTNFKSFPYIAKFNNAEVKPDSFIRVMTQAHLSYGLALLNYDPSIASFKEVAKLLEGYIEQIISFQNIYLIFQVYKKLFATLDLNATNLEKEKCYLRLVEYEFLKSLKFQLENSRMKHEYVHLFITILTKMIQNKEPKEFVFALWDKIQCGITTLQGKIISDSLMQAAKKYKCAYKDELEAISKGHFIKKAKED